MDFTKISQFPVTPHLEKICGILKNSPSHCVVLTAETGAGKSTILPLGLLEAFDKKILMTEPRRVAVLGVASRVSELLGEECGRTAGYKIALDSCIGKETRLEVMTEAILVRLLQENPAAEGYDVIVLDEFHERSVQQDLALAFLKEALELRDDLYVVIMSATINCEQVAQFLGSGFSEEIVPDKNDSQVDLDGLALKYINGVPVVKIGGRTFPVEVIYKEDISVEKAVIQELEKPFVSKLNSSGEQAFGNSLLVFLPGIGEIKRAKENLIPVLEKDFPEVELLVLHSSVSIEEQKKVISGGKARRVILSSAIAETSLTVPDIGCVIDSGLSRINRKDVRTGMQKLVTEKESVFSSEQRKGRAGRITSGRCIRLWNELDLRQKQVEPEIRRCDLAEVVLECAERGISELEKISWLTEPNGGEWQESKKLLSILGFLKEGKITKRGQAALKLGSGVRLSGIALSGYSLSGGLSPKARELLIKYGSYSESSAAVQNRFIQDVERRLSKLELQNKGDKLLNNLLVLSGFPDRLALRITQSGVQPAEYQFPVGRKAYLHESLKNAPRWICAPEVLERNSSGVIFAFEALEEKAVEEWLSDKTDIRTVVSFDEGKIRKVNQKVFGQLVLEEKRAEVTDSDFGEAWVTEIREKGLKALPSDKKIESLLNRRAFYEQQAGICKETEVSVNKLSETAREWLLPFIGSSRNLTAEIVYNALYWYLNGSDVDKKVPEMIVLPNGKKAKIKYELLASPQDKNLLVIRPVIEIIIQQIFGCTQTPQILGMKVLLKLLSPASRPLQITDDLENFWTGAWVEICREMKGRYPKHNWNPEIQN